MEEGKDVLGLDIYKGVGLVVCVSYIVNCKTGVFMMKWVLLGHDMRSSWRRMASPDIAMISRRCC